ncbi:uncharacterized protein [Miscanthus floridulus]|uniref:uncharacterized protein n=1 Tax=Miscanthus floridulus TaxID=154761 RepID=UPI0034574453
MGPWPPDLGVGAVGAGFGFAGGGNGAAAAWRPCTCHPPRMARQGRGGGRGEGMGGEGEAGAGAGAAAGADGGGAGVAVGGRRRGVLGSILASQKPSFIWLTGTHNTVGSSSFFKGMIWAAKAAKMGYRWQIGNGKKSNSGKIIG